MSMLSVFRIKDQKAVFHLVFTPQKKEVTGNLISLQCFKAKYKTGRPVSVCMCASLVIAIFKRLVTRRCKLTSASTEY